MTLYLPELEIAGEALAPVQMLRSMLRTNSSVMEEHAAPTTERLIAKLKCAQDYSRMSSIEQLTKLGTLAVPSMIKNLGSADHDLRAELLCILDHSAAHSEHFHKRAQVLVELKEKIGGLDDSDPIAIEELVLQAKNLVYEEDLQPRWQQLLLLEEVRKQLKQLDETTPAYICLQNLEQFVAEKIEEIERLTKDKVSLILRIVQSCISHEIAKTISSQISSLLTQLRARYQQLMLDNKNDELLGNAMAELVYLEYDVSQLLNSEEQLSSD
jgi:hypothetical protein